MHDIVLLEKKGRIGIITLNRPRVMNSINFKLISDISRVLEEVEAAVSAGSVYPENVGFMVNKIIIPNPHKETFEFVL